MRYIAIEEAKEGMQVGKAILNENGNILVNKGVQLTEALIQRMEEKDLSGLYITDKLSADIEIEQLISDAVQQKAENAVKKMDIDCAMEAAAQIAEQIASLPVISVNMVNLKTKSDYTYKHSVNVAVLSTILGIGIGLHMDLLKELSTSALLHDIGKMQIPSEILDKPGKLTQEEYELMKKHPEYGYNMIKGNVMITSKIKMGVYMHHENMDGSGYPMGLKDKEIYLFAKIIHIADVYDAISSQRSYKKAELPGKAVQFLMHHAGTMFQQEYVQIFIDYIPLYPKGRTVILNNGKKAIVVENKDHYTLYPVIRLFDGTTIDLSQERELELEIVGVMN